MRKLAIFLAAILTLNLTAPAASVYAAPVDSETETVVSDEEESAENVEIMTTEEDSDEETEEIESVETENTEDVKETSEENSGEIGSVEETEEGTTEEGTTEVETTEEMTIGTLGSDSMTTATNATELEARALYLQDTYYYSSQGYPMVASFDLPIENTLRGNDASEKMKINSMHVIVDGGEPIPVTVKKYLMKPVGDAADGTNPALECAIYAGCVKEIEPGEHTISYTAEVEYSDDGNSTTDVYSVTTPEKKATFVNETIGDKSYEDETQYMPTRKKSFIRMIYASLEVAKSTEKINSFKIYKHGTTDTIDYMVLGSNAYVYTSTERRYEDMGNFNVSDLNGFFPDRLYTTVYGTDIYLNEDIPEGYYDIVYTTTAGRKLTREKAYCATNKTIVYDIKETNIESKNSTYSAVPVFADNSGEYVSVFVYGLNLTKANVPTFYDAEGSNALTQYSEADSGCGAEAWEYGCDYSLKKTGNINEGASYPIRVSGDNVLYVKNYTVKEQTVVYKHNIELVNRSELNTNDKYFRIYFSNGTVTEGESVQIKVGTQSYTMDFTGNVISDGNEYYVEFTKNTDMYSTISELIDSWCKVTVYDEDGNSSEFYSSIIQQPKTITNFTAPTNSTWEIHSVKDVGNIIFSGTTTAKGNVLTDAQIAKLKEKQAYRICIRYRSGSEISDECYLAFFKVGEVYTIEYELNGGENHPDNPTEYSKNDSYTLKAPTKEYHTFAGWYSDEKFTKKVTQIAKGSTGNKKFYAKWIPYTYTVAYNANGGSGKINSTKGTCDKEIILAKNTFKRQGYTFVEWNTQADGGGKSYEQNTVLKDLPLTNNATVTLYAIWAPINYTLVLDRGREDAKDGTLSVSGNSFIASYGEEYELTGEEYELTGYSLTSWKMNTGKKVANGTIKNLTTVADATVTLTAQWTLEKYALTYDYDGGKVKKANPKNYTYESVDITFTEPTRTGYHFDGYYTVDPDSPEWTEESRIEGIKKGTLTGAQTIYAKWSPISYTIIFTDKEGAAYGDGITEESTRVTMKYGDVLTFTDGYYVKPGYSLTSWSGKVNGKNLKYTVGKGYSNLTANDGDEITLYANWSKNSYTITYNLDGGKNDKKNPTKYAIDSSDIKLKDPTKKGATFEGWYLTDEAGNLADNPITVITGSFNSNLVLTAKWRVVTYLVQLEPNTRDYISPEDLAKAEAGVYRSYDYDTVFDPQNWSNEYPATDVWKEYGILYWSTKPNGTGTKYYPGKEYSGIATGGTLKVYAKWGLKPYTISYDYGTVDAKGISNKNPATFTYDANKTITLKSISKAGYVFNGWYTDSSFEEKYKVTSIRRNTYENIILYADLKPINYTIKLNPNGKDVIAKDGIITEIPMKYDESYVLEADAYTREHYQFNYWTTKANGTGTKIDATGGDVPLTKTNGATVNLYPKWELIPYDITYNNVTFENEKVVNKNPATYTYNAKKDISLKNPTRTGYVFGGWYEEDTTANDFDASTATKVTKIVRGSEGDKVLYALWTPIRYKIKLNANAKNAESGTVAINSAAEVIEVTYGEEVCLNKDFYVRDGYDLVGYNSKSNGKGTWYTMGHLDCIYATKANSTVNVYAIWEKVSPQKVIGVELTADNSSVTVTFNAPEECYKYELAVSSSFTMKHPITIWTHDGNGTVSNLESGKRYYVRVREVRFDSKGNEVKGPWSNLKSIVTE